MEPGNVWRGNSAANLGGGVLHRLRWVYVLTWGISTRQTQTVSNKKVVRSAAFPNASHGRPASEAPRELTWTAPQTSAAGSEPAIREAAARCLRQNKNRQSFTYWEATVWRTQNVTESWKHRQWFICERTDVKYHDTYQEGERRKGRHHYDFCLSDENMWPNIYSVCLQFDRCWRKKKQKALYFIF